MKTLLPIESIQERDIDLLLLEELYSSEAFRAWFIEHTIKSAQKRGQYCWVMHSLCMGDLGESDLAMKYTGKDNKGYLFLIENKIDASFQPQQAMRYCHRGEKYIKEKECDAYCTVLVAPKKYIRDNEDFNFVIQYEAIKEWFLARKELGDRAKYKAEMLDIAIEKSRRGYRPIPDEKTIAFWRAYWELANEIAPELKMKEPRKDIPVGSSWIFFKPNSLKKGLCLIHKANHGYVDLEFTGKGEQIDILQNKYGSVLKKEMLLEKTNKSAVIRLPVKPLNTQGDFNKQKDFAIAALQKAQELLAWQAENV